jgi:superfamily I DNA/RNA helicase
MMGRFVAVYKEYQDMLKQNGLHDFDDLILEIVTLFETDQVIREAHEKRFRYISVDEYQDINHAQYRLIRLLAPKGHDICVIGDPHQAIYGFRGADVRYFHTFCNDYPGAKTIWLRQNYRSTETILRASGQLIGMDDTKRADEGLWSGLHGAETLVVAGLPTERAEAEYVVETIDREVGGIAHFSMNSGRIDSCQTRHDRSFRDFAVLYRTKELGRALEEAFARSGIPFQVVGKEKLEDKKGIREVVSYLKAARGLTYSFDVERILNFPARGIGRNTVSALKEWCEKNGVSLIAAVEHADEVSGLKPGPARKIRAFARDLARLKTSIQGVSVYEQIDYICSYFGIMDAMGGDKAFEEDITALLGLSRSFGSRVLEFLAHLALEGVQDRYDPAVEKVSLMTMHAAKGLEFPVVFVVGCEDGLIPYRKTNGEQGDVLEEKRLFYVAITRAQDRIYLTHAKKRLLYGKKILQNPSPFLEAVEENLKEYAKPLPVKRRRKKEDPQLRLFEV